MEFTSSQSQPDDVDDMSSGENIDPANLQMVVYAPPKEDRSNYSRRLDNVDDTLNFLDPKYVIKSVEYENGIVAPLRDSSIYDNNQSHIVISVFAHGRVAEDTLPSELSDNTFCFSLSSPDGLAVTYNTDVDETDLYREKKFTSVVSNYAKTLLQRDFPILNVLNHLRQLFTRDNVLKSYDSYRLSKQADAIRGYHKLRGQRAKDKISKFETGLQNSFSEGKNRGTDAERTEFDDASINAMKEYAAQEMLRKNKYAYLHVPVRNMNYTSDSLFSNNHPRDAIRVDIRVLDVRYPKTARQRDLLNKDARYEIMDNVVDHSKNETTLAKILTYLKGGLGFDYVTIVETTCREDELNFRDPSNDVRNATLDETNLLPNKEHVAEITEKHYANQRNDANRYLKRVKYWKFGGSRRSRRATRASRRRGVSRKRGTRRLCHHLSRR
jgi:hypothetical protein